MYPVHVQVHAIVMCYSEDRGRLQLDDARAQLPHRLSRTGQDLSSVGSGSFAVAELRGLPSRRDDCAFRSMYADTLIIHGVYMLSYISEKSKIFRFCLF